MRIGDIRATGTPLRRTVTTPCPPDTKSNTLDKDVSKSSYSITLGILYTPSLHSPNRLLEHFTNHPERQISPHPFSGKARIIITHGDAENKRDFARTCRSRHDRMESRHLGDGRAALRRGHFGEAALSPLRLVGSARRAGRCGKAAPALQGGARRPAEPPPLLHIHHHLEEPHGGASRPRRAATAPSTTFSHGDQTSPVGPQKIPSREVKT